MIGVIAKLTIKEIGRKLGDYLAGRPDVQVMQEV